MSIFLGWPVYLKNNSWEFDSLNAVFVLLKRHT